MFRVDRELTTDEVSRWLRERAGHVDSKIARAYVKAAVLLSVEQERQRLNVEEILGQ
jgi:hypothetical protein